MTTLLAAPRLLAWAAFLAAQARSFRMLVQQAGALALGAALSACACASMRAGT